MANKYLTYASVPLLAASIAATMPVQAVTVEQLNRQVQKMNQRLSAQDQRFRVNGFASFGLAMSDEAIAYDSITEDLDFRRMSKVGVQMTFNLDEKNSVVTQLVSRGLNQWETEAEWAFFRHQFNNSVSTKIGRIRLPAFMFSEYLDVGYAYPWTETPRETYESLEPFANMDGVDISYSMDVGFNTLTFQLAAGRSISDQFDLKELISVNGVFQADTWNARVSYSQSSDMEIRSGTATEINTPVTQIYGGDDSGITGTFASLGFTYDPGHIYLASEFTRLEVDGEVVDADAGYFAVGYRMGRMMPILTYGFTESQDDDERSLQAAADNSTGGDTSLLPPATATGVAQFQAGNNRDTTRIGLGLRYDMSPGTALKVQYDVIEADAGGMFTAADYAATGANAPDGTNILTITIDTVF
ncbi:porin [Bermanella sp. R86510]|uniref:porin n=1 Tax=unclassified Bermanella TaxID=2627862 RepID=UPI0037C6E275